MESLSVVEDLNIFKHSLFSVRSSLIGLVVYQFSFQGMKEAFRHRVIPAIVNQQYPSVSLIM